LKNDRGDKERIRLLPRLTRESRCFSPMWSCILLSSPLPQRFSKPGKLIMNQQRPMRRGPGPLAGKGRFILLAVGLIGRAFSVPILAGSASYAVAEAFGWKRNGLDEKPASRTPSSPFRPTHWINHPIFLGIQSITALLGQRLLTAFLAAPILV